MDPETEQTQRNKSYFGPWDHGGLVGAGMSDPRVEE